MTDQEPSSVPAPAESGERTSGAQGYTAIGFSQQVFWEGPLPPAQELARYKELVPDAPERILVLAEQQAAVRRETELQIVKSHTSNQTLGTVFGFLLGLAGMGAGVYIATIGSDLMGFVSIIGTLAALAGVFVVGRKAKE